MQVSAILSVGWGWLNPSFQARSNYCALYAACPHYCHNCPLHPGLRILLYSGDADASVPALGTRYWLSVLGLRQGKGTANWRTWSSSTGQVGAGGAGAAIIYNPGSGCDNLRGISPPFIRS